MDKKRRVSVHLFARAAAALFGIVCAVGGAATPARADQTLTTPILSLPAAAQVAQDHQFCPLSPYVRPIDESRTRYEVTLSSITSRIASGIVTLYSGDERYDVPFANLVVEGMGGTLPRPTQLVVRFMSPTTIDGAWVSAVGDPDGGPCRAPYRPWSTRGKQDFAFLENPSPSTRAWQSSISQLIPTDAPAPIREPRTCSLPDQSPRTLHAVTPTNADPLPPQVVVVAVFVLIDDHDSVIAAEVATPSGYPHLDASALNSAKQATFRSATFRCHNAVSMYKYAVSFGS